MCSRLCVLLSKPTKINPSSLLTVSATITFWSYIHTVAKVTMVSFKLDMKVVHHVVVNVTRTLKARGSVIVRSTSTESWVVWWKSMLGEKRVFPAAHTHWNKRWEAQIFYKQRINVVSMTSIIETSYTFYIFCDNEHSNLQHPYLVPSSDRRHDLTQVSLLRCQVVRESL